MRGKDTYEMCVISNSSVLGEEKEKVVNKKLPLISSLQSIIKTFRNIVYTITKRYNNPHSY